MASSVGSKEFDSIHYQFVVIGGGIAGVTCAETVIIKACLIRQQSWVQHSPVEVAHSPKNKNIM